MIPPVVLVTLAPCGAEGGVPGTVVGVVVLGGRVVVVAGTVVVVVGGRVVVVVDGAVVVVGGTVVVVVCGIVVVVVVVVVLVVVELVLVVLVVVDVGAGPEPPNAPRPFGVPSPVGPS